MQSDGRQYPHRPWPAAETTLRSGAAAGHRLPVSPAGQLDGQLSASTSRASANRCRLRSDLCQGLLAYRVRILVTGSSGHLGAGRPPTRSMTRLPQPATRPATAGSGCPGAYPPAQRPQARVGRPQPATARCAPGPAGHDCDATRDADDCITCPYRTLSTSTGRPSARTNSQFRRYCGRSSRTSRHKIRTGSSPPSDTTQGDHIS